MKQYPSDQEMERYMATLTVGDGGVSLSFYKVVNHLFAEVNQGYSRFNEEL